MKRIVLMVIAFGGGLAQADQALSTNETESVNETAGTNVTRRANITSDTTFYDRKEGILIFNGNVHVDDTEYQLHSDKAFVFLEGTNDLKRIVATGKVALTNANRMAYGEKATYRKDSGVVVLYGKEGSPAEVRDVTPNGDRVVRGRKIRFWVNEEQVEVEGADISAPASGDSNINLGVLKKK